MGYIVQFDSLFTCSMVCFIYKAIIILGCGIVYVIFVFLTEGLTLATIILGKVFCAVTFIELQRDKLYFRLRK
jgi:hypothetical protein